MKILFTAPRFHTNQVPIVRGLREKGHEVAYFVVFVGETEDHRYCEPTVIRPSKTTERQKKKLSRTTMPSEAERILGGQFIPDAADLRKHFEEFAPDLVVCREKTNFTLFVKSLCDEHGTPCILYDQEPVYKLMQKNKNAPAPSARASLLRRIGIKAERTLNPDLRKLMQYRNTSGFPTVHVTPVEYTLLPRELSSETADPSAYLLPFVAEQEEQLSSETAPGGILRILSVGKFRDYKNLPLLVSAAALLPKDTWRMTIVGQASNADELEYKARLEEQIREAGLEDRITLMTNVPHTEIGGIYRAHDVFILSSQKEKASIAVLEAMSFGLAVISTSHNGTASYIREGVNGYVFTSGDAQSLADAVEKIRNGGLADMKASSAELVRVQYSFDAYYGRFTTLLEQEFGGIKIHER